MNKKTYWSALAVVTILGGILRFGYLDRVPNHMGNDEISIAYDSYSIRTTGKDEYGIPYPLSFKSHRDYKAPLYAYLDVPFNLILGNNEYGARGLSAVTGTLMVLGVGIMTTLIAGKNVGLAAAILMATNPKSIFVSRMGFEANLASGLLLLGVALIWFFTNKKRWYLGAGAGVFFGLSVWAYHTPKGLAPLLMLILPMLMPKKVEWKKWLPMWIIAGMIAAPIMYDYVFVQLKDPYNRASSQIWYKGRQIEQVWQEDKSTLKKLMITAADPVYRYFDHYNLDLLFGSGLNILPKNEPLGQGWFLIGCLPLLVLGLINLKKVAGDDYRWLWGWFVICPIIPSLTSGEVASVRNLAWVTPAIIIMACGFGFSLRKSRKTALAATLLLIINFIYFLMAYYVHFPVVSGDNFQYGYKQVWQSIEPVAKEFDRIVVEPRFGEYGQFVGLPRLYLGYFGAFDPVTMQSRDESSAKIGKYEIRPVDWNRETIKVNSLYVVSVINPTVNQASEKLKLWKIIKKPDSKEQFLIYRTL